MIANVCTGTLVPVQVTLCCWYQTQSAPLDRQAGNYPALGGGPVVSIQCSPTTPSQAAGKETNQLIQSASCFQRLRISSTSSFVSQSRLCRASPLRKRARTRGPTTRLAAPRRASHVSSRRDAALNGFFYVSVDLSRGSGALLVEVPAGSVVCGDWSPRRRLSHKQLGFMEPTQHAHTSCSRAHVAALWKKPLREAGNKNGKIKNVLCVKKKKKIII